MRAGRRRNVPPVVVDNWEAAVSGSLKERGRLYQYSCDSLVEEIDRVMEDPRAARSVLVRAITSKKTMTVGHDKNGNGWCVHIVER